jgi:flavin reductase (DIM6/NTAB) family NADH-FMN oxidoreductase RutF
MPVREPSTDSAVDESEFRNACGRFATGVTVVTTARDDTAHGMTANAFMSVSLDPPLIVVSVDEGATMHDWLQEVGRYGVSVLAEWQEAYCWHFAGQPQDDLDVRFSWEDGIPLIDHALAHFVADVEDAHPAGDHTLFVGRVRFLRTDPLTGSDPLVVHGGSVTQLVSEDVEGYTWHPSF